MMRLTRHDDIQVLDMPTLIHSLSSFGGCITSLLDTNVWNSDNLLGGCITSKYL
jgi:hypothetical protein